MINERYDIDGVSKVFLTNSNGKIEPQQWGAYSNTGGGKTLLEGGIKEAHYDHNFNIFYLGDGGKGEEEGAFSMFPVTEKWHLEVLRKEGRQSRIIPTRIFHPFTFNLPKKSMPNYEIFTIPVKSLGRSEFSMLAETQATSDTIRLMMLASQNLSKNAGVFQLLHDVQDLIKGKNNSKPSPSSKNFYLSVSSGTAKSMQDISNLFQPFRRDYFLVDENCKYNLDFKELMRDNKHIKFFSTRFLKDDKQKEFLILLLLQKIIEYKEYAKSPVMIIIPEIRKLCPSKNEGYKRFLSEGIKDALSTMRNMGEGFASFLSSQNWSDTSQEIRDSHSVTLLGKLSLSDIDKISKIRTLNKEIRDELAQPSERNVWRVLGREDDGIHFFISSTAHCETDSNFDKIFEKYYPEKMCSFADMIYDMDLKIKSEEEKFKEKIQKQQEAERIREKRKQEQKQNKNPQSDNQEIKKIKQEQKIKDYERAYNLRKSGMTLEEGGKTMGIGKDTFDRWVRKYKQILNKKEMNNISP